MRIYKYPIPLESEQKLTVNGLVKFLDVQEQHGHLMAWALVNPDSDEPRDLIIRIVGTGHEVEYNLLSNWSHWKTVVTIHDIVWHLFVNHPHLIGRQV